MGIVHDAVTQLIGEPTNYAGETVFWVGEFFLVYLLILGILVIITKIAFRR